MHDYIKYASKDIAKQREEQAKLEKEKREKDRLVEKKHQRKLEAEQREKERKDELARKKEEHEQKDKIASLLAEASSLYRDGAYSQAQEKYREIIKLDEENRTARRYLEVIPEKIEEAEKAREIEKLIAEVNPIYHEALNSYKEKDYTTAREKLLRVKKIYPNYERTNYYLNRVDKEICKEEDRRLREKIQSLIKEAEALYKNENYDEALLKFKEVLKLDSKNQVAQGYLLKLILKQIEEEKEHLEQKSQPQPEAEQEEKQRRLEAQQREVERQQKMAQLEKELSERERRHQLEAERRERQSQKEAAQQTGIHTVSEFLFALRQALVKVFHWIIRQLWL